jgi:hypothetical protein
MYTSIHYHHRLIEGNCLPEETLTDLKESLKKIADLIILIEKDISGVRLRSASILKHEELRKQVELVIQTIDDDIKKVEKGVNPLKQYFLLRNKSLNAISNLNNSLDKMVNESTSTEEIKEIIRLFAKDAQEEFVISIQQLEKLWNKEIKEIMESMKKVISIMQVTHEKIVRYKRECNIEDDVESDIERLLDFLFDGNVGEFQKLEQELRTKLLPEG